MNHILLF